MDFPKLTFAPAGNTARGWSQNELIDLNDIFDDDFFPSELDFSNFFHPENSVWAGAGNDDVFASQEDSQGTEGGLMDLVGESFQYLRQPQNLPSTTYSTPFPLQRDLNPTPTSVPLPLPPSLGGLSMSSNNTNNNINMNSINSASQPMNQYQNQFQNKNENHMFNQMMGQTMFQIPLQTVGSIPGYGQQASSSSGNQASTTSKTGVIMIPPVMPRAMPLEKIKDEPLSPGGAGSLHDKFDPDGDDNDGSNKKRKKVKGIDLKDMTEEQRLERRERNREHAKKSRIRKRVLLDLLQDQLSGLRGENVKLRRVVIERLPQVANKVFEQCTSEVSLLLLEDEDEEFDAPKARPKHADEVLATKMISGPAGSVSVGPKQVARILMEPDFRLIEALIHSQQNFVLSDPSLPDNPIVYCSDGFCNLTGYKRSAIIGRNCRFLQGPGTDQAAVDIIRKGVLEGCDISVCLLNYKADGSPFWNQFFVAALRDSEGGVVNYVGVQCEVNTLPIEGIKDRVKRLPVPIL